MSTDSRELYDAAEQIDHVYPKRVGGPDQRIQWILAAIKRDGLEAVQKGTAAFAAACKECGLCRRRPEEWKSVPYPQKFFGKKFAYYLQDPDDQFCISNNRVFKRVQPGSPVDTTPVVSRDDSDPDYARRFAAWKAKQ